MIIDSLDKYWFIAEGKDDRWIKHLIMAKSIVDATRCLGSLIDDYNLRRVTWNELSLITNCIIPSNVDRTQQAKGYITIKHGSRFFTLQTV